MTSASPPAGNQPETTASAAHAYASNGLEVLQAATDAAKAAQDADKQAQENAVVAAAVQALAGVADAHQHHHGMAPPPPMSYPLPLVPAQPVAPGPTPSPGGPGGAPSAQSARDPSVNPKLTRLRRACDMCSQRKVKCDEAGPPCRPCRELNVECTFHRALKRRGPPNKHAELARATQRARMDVDGAPLAGSPAYGASGSSSSPHNAAQTLVSIASHDGTARLDAESIAPWPVLELLVDDFFTYLYPLAPVPYEPSFRASFLNREDRTNPEFLGLLASMIGALVASFPRAAREHLKSTHGAHLFPRSSAMVDKCQDIVLETRGAAWHKKQPKTLEDAITSYFLGLASGYSLQRDRSFEYMEETLRLIRALGWTQPKTLGVPPTFGSDTTGPSQLPFNHVKDQIGNRLFWCLLLGVRSQSQIDPYAPGVLIPPSTPSLPYPAYPEDVDDPCILPNEILFPANNPVSLLTGFRTAIEIYTTMTGIVSIDMSYGMSTLPWSDQINVIREASAAAKAIWSRLPAELQLGPSADLSSGFAYDANLQYVPPAYPTSQVPNDVRYVIKTDPGRRRQLQYEIQKANIFASLLVTRSYFVDMYHNLRDTHRAAAAKAAPGDNSPADGADPDDDDPSGTAAFMAAEREQLVQDLLTVLGAVTQRNLEPNGGSLVTKLRLVAATLLGDPPDRKGPVALRSEAGLARLLEVMDGLGRNGVAGADGAGGPAAASMTAQDEEDESGRWTELRDFQTQFAANAGFTGEL